MTRVKAAEMMGALYEDVEKFFGDIFAWYGRIVARCPLPFVLLPVLICGLLSLGLLQIKYETDLEKLYTPVDSLAFKHKQAVEQLFPDEETRDFYSYQEVVKGPYAEVILRPFPGTEEGPSQQPNILLPDTLMEIENMVNFIRNISVRVHRRAVNYEDICATRFEECVEEGVGILAWTNYTDSENGCVVFNNSRTKRSTLDYVKLNNVLSGLSFRNNCLVASALRLRFNLRRNGSEATDVSLAWEEEFLKQTKDYRSELVAFTYVVSESLNIELSRPVLQDLTYFAVALGVIVVYASVIGSGGNCVTNHVTLAYAGVVAALLAIVASFGFLSLCGLPFVNICGVMPFMVLGVGADDMFQLMTEWRQTNIRDSIAERMSHTLRSAAVSITITSMTNLLAFLIGATSPFISVKNFCACSGVAVVMCYVNQLTFFSGCIVLHAQRVQASRHCITCLPTTSREEMEDEHKHVIQVVLCSGHAPRKAGDEGGLCRKLSRILYTIYPRFILHWVTKCVVMLLFFTYIGVSIWGASQLQQGLKFQHVLNEDSYMHRYIEWDVQDFPDKGPVVMFVVDEAVQYHTRTIQTEVARLLREATEVDCVQSGSLVSWLDALLSYTNSSTSWTSEADFVSFLLGDFLPLFPQYVHDVKLDVERQSVAASRFYVMCRKMTSSKEEMELIRTMRAVANDSPLPVKAYSTEFIYYEADISILKNTLLAVGVTMIGMLFVALVFIPHPIAVTCVTLSMFSVVVGMKGFMFFWQLTLSAFTTIQIIISVGLCVNFTVQISHAFMTATGKNRNERVTVALEKVGIPILNGAFSSLLCIFILFLGESYVFTAMFKTMMLVAILGLLHSLVFLPVMLSFIGPRRTSKPRVFIPVSPSSRSLQDIYKTNSMIRPPASEPTKKRKNPLIITRSDTDPSLGRSRSDSDLYPDKDEEERRRVSFAYGKSPQSRDDNTLPRARFITTGDVDSEESSIVIEATPSPVIKFKLLPRITDSDQADEAENSTV